MAIKVRSLTFFRRDAKLSVWWRKILWHVKEAYRYKELFQRQKFLLLRYQMSLLVISTEDWWTNHKWLKLKWGGTTNQKWLQSLGHFAWNHPLKITVTPHAMFTALILWVWTQQNYVLKWWHFSDVFEVCTSFSVAKWAILTEEVGLSLQSQSHTHWSLHVATIHPTVRHLPGILKSLGLLLAEMNSTLPEKLQQSNIF
jgi:hypothetical protein